MNSFSKIIVTALSIILFSCIKDDQPQFATVDIVAFITVLDEQGNNLLDPKQASSYDPNKIRIYYERNGKMEEFFEANLDMPRNFRIDPPQFGNDYLMAIGLDAEKTVIKWNETESDTLYAEFRENKEEAIIVTKVFHSGELKHDSKTAKTRREFTIIK